MENQKRRSVGHHVASRVPFSRGLCRCQWTLPENFFSVVSVPSKPMELTMLMKMPRTSSEESSGGTLRTTSTMNAL